MTEFPRMKIQPHRRNFVPDSFSSKIPDSIPTIFTKDRIIANGNGVNGVRNNIFDDLPIEIQMHRSFARNNSEINTKHDALVVNANDKSNQPHRGQKPQHPWYYLSPIQIVCVAILLLLFLLLLVFTVIVKRQKRKRLEMAQKYGYDLQKRKKKHSKRQINSIKPKGNANFDNTLITPVHTPTASVDKTSIKGDNNKHV